MLPSLCLLKARSLFSKLDELTALLATKPVDLVAITESWLRSDIDDTLLSMSAFNLFRKDRVAGRGGGICVYLNNVIPCKQCLDLENPNFECLWLTLRPRRLPRPLSGIAICVVYHPPCRPADSLKELNDYLINTTERLCNEHPDHGLVLLGDFNDFDCSNLVTHHSLKQVVQQPTRDSAILDLILTNMHNLCSSPTTHAPLGSSDHNIILWHPSQVHRPSPGVKSTQRLMRHYPRSGIDAFGRWATTHEWFIDLGPSPSVDDLASSFTIQLTDAIDRILSVKTIKLHRTDKPWITPELKLMIKDRQKAFHSGNIPTWRSLKYKVQQEIAKRKKSF